MHKLSRSTLKDLADVEGQAELVRGKIVRYPFHGWKTGHIVQRIARSLHDHAERTGQGEAHTSTLAYAIPELPLGRESFCPDASFYDGPLPADPMSFIEGPPTLAVETRSERDDGPSAEAQRFAKRSDYFAAGTQVVWDVDPKAEVIHVYRAADPDAPTTYHRGDQAEAEPAVPGWRVDVAWIFG